MLRGWRQEDRSAPTCSQEPSVVVLALCTIREGSIPSRSIRKAEFEGLSSPDSVLQSQLVLRVFLASERLVNSPYAKHYSTRATPQAEPVPGKAMVPNSGGGFGFEVDDWVRLDRFLILGSEGGSYYASEKKLTIENARCVLRCLDLDPERVVNQIVAISDAGRAPRNDPAIFALAIACGHTNPSARRLAEAALPKVCRIGTHLFQFIEAVKGFRGFGQGLKRAVGTWYNSRSPEQLAYQLAKYQQRNGMSHRDVLRLAHPTAITADHDAVLRWAVAHDTLGVRAVKRGDKVSSYADRSPQLPAILAAVDEAKRCDRPALTKLIREHDLPRECVPTEALNDPHVWAALAEKMPLAAMIRSLAKMSAVGLLKPLSEIAKTVADRLADREHIRKSRMHPMSILVAAKTYAQGHGEKGKLSWQPVSTINDALDAAFYLAFQNVDPTGKKLLLALDVSGSMVSPVAGLPISCREASAVLAMVTANVEPDYVIVGFTANQKGYGGQWGEGDPTLTPIDVARSSRLSDVIQRLETLPMGGTDCSLPMRWATANAINVDCFAVYTDNETWAGPIHPCQALRQYREKTGRPAKSAVLAMTATEFSIADPDDAGMLDLVGLDATTPAVLADFARG
jgi:60 kDa SS-A/Ro ribonucleoprotein